MVWLRYSLFIILYPTGVLSELLCIWLTRDCAMNVAMATAQPNTMSGWVFQTLKFSLGSAGLTSSTTRYYGFFLMCYIVGLPHSTSRFWLLGRSSWEETRTRSGRRKQRRISKRAAATVSV